MNRYDIVLVFTFFRRLGSYLSIVKFLSRRYRVGIYCAPIEPGLLKKNAAAQELFLNCCKTFGASIVTTAPVKTKVALYPQDDYPDSSREAITSEVHCQKALGLLTLSWPGLHDDFLECFNIAKAYVVDRHFLEFLLQHRGDKTRYNRLELIEVGLPFGKYPVVDEFHADYMLAMPTPFSFAHDTDKIHFLEAISQLLDRLDPQDVVVHKPHNALDFDHFSGKKYRQLARLLSTLPRRIVTANLHRKCANGFNSSHRHWQRLYIAYLYEGVLQRVKLLTDLTPYYNFPIEMFLPKVMKGVIGGLSNTIWGALYFKKPYYNCIDLSRQNRDAADTLYKKNPTQLLDLNLQYFGVPYCKGELDFEADHFNIVKPSAREGDLIAELTREIQTCSG